MIRHAGGVGAGTDTLPISTLTVVVIEASRLTPLMPRIGCAELPTAGARATLRSAVGLAAVTMQADEEHIPAMTARQLQQNDIFAVALMWHAPEVQALDNSRPFLSRLENTCGRLKIQAAQSGGDRSHGRLPSNAAGDQLTPCR